MSDKIYLVQGDTRPDLVFSITDQNTGLPIDLSTATTVVKFRANGSTTVKATMNCVPLPGIVQADGTVSAAAPYNVAGFGGRVAMTWSPTALDTAGDFEGEIEVTFTDGTVQTIYDLLKFKVRSQF